MDLRTPILERMKELDLTAYQLSHCLRDSGASERTVTRYIRGENDTTTKVLGLIYELLKITASPHPIELSGPHKLLLRRKLLDMQK